MGMHLLGGGMRDEGGRLKPTVLESTEVVNFSCFVDLNKSIYAIQQIFL